MHCSRFVCRQVIDVPVTSHLAQARGDRKKGAASSHGAFELLTVTQTQEKAGQWNVAHHLLHRMVIESLRLLPCEPVCTCLLALLQHETLMELEESLLQHPAKKSLG